MPIVDMSFKEWFKMEDNTEKLLSEHYAKMQTRIDIDYYYEQMRKAVKSESLKKE